MVVIDYGYGKTQVLVHNAPVDEKTKNIRKMFKVDEKTGYPEHYDWRGMARLGRTYSYTDPSEKFDPYDPKTSYGFKLMSASAAVAVTAVFHFYSCYSKNLPYYTQLHKTIPMIGLGIYGTIWLHDYLVSTQGLNTSIYNDYVRKHPERFGEIYRPKVREILMAYVPRR